METRAICSTPFVKASKTSRFKKTLSALLIFAATLLVLRPVPAAADVRADAAADFQSGWFVNMQRFSQSAHTGFDCEVCHGTMEENSGPHPDPKNPDFLKKDAIRTYDYTRCKTCHQKSHERYLIGEHAKALAKESQIDAADPNAVMQALKNPAPTCGDCHSAHYDRSQLSRIESGQKMVTVCGACHLDQQRSYLENYHGKAAANLGSGLAAYCTDCHGAHSTLSLKDRQVRLKSCQRCHPEAGQEFADAVIHYSTEDITEMDPEKKIVVSRIRVISIISLAFIVVLLVCFYSHTLLLMLRKIHEKLRKQP